MVFVQVLLRKTQNQETLSPFVHQLENIQSAGQHLSELINGILDLSKIEAGKIEILEEWFDVKNLVLDIYHINQVKAETKGVLFNYELGDDLPKEMYPTEENSNKF